MQQALDRAAMADDWPVTRVTGGLTPHQTHAVSSPKHAILHVQTSTLPPIIAVLSPKLWLL
jgi:hypothetical protein